MWVARDKDGSLWGFINECPVRNEEEGIWESAKYLSEINFELPDIMFPDLKWEDNPIKVEFKVIKENGNN